MTIIFKSVEVSVYYCINFHYNIIITIKLIIHVEMINEYKSGKHN